MANPRRFFTSDIGNQIVSLISTNLATSLGLKLCGFGKLRHYRSINLTQYLPFVIIVPETIESELGRPHFCDVDYRYRGLYCRRIQAGESSKIITIQNVQQILELLINNLGLKSLTGLVGYDNLRIKKQFPIEVDWEPQESTGFANLEHQIHAVTFTIDVPTEPLRSPTNGGF